jgi:protein TonB
MPKPIYPPAAKRQKQTGTVVVQFTVNPSGQVTAAFAKSSSNWPLLDAEALRTVLTWTFPQGGMMTKTQPIIFKLD